MLVVLQFPFADLRPLMASATPARVGPDWRNPPDFRHPDFVRGFGGLRKRTLRSRGSGSAWPSEAWFARAASAIRLPELTPKSFPRAGVQLKPYHAVRRVFSDGSVTWRVEVGVALNAAALLSSDHVMDTVADLLMLPVRVRKRGQWSPARKLIEQGDAIGEALTTSTTSLKLPPEGVALRLGRPMVLVESRTGEERESAALPARDAEGQPPVAPLRVATLRVGRLDLPFAWIRRADAIENADALRVNLFRLHAERENLTSVLRAVNGKQLSPPAPELERYLSRAHRNLFIEQRDGIDQAKLRDVFNVYDSFAPEDVQALRGQLADRRQTLDRTQRLADSYREPDDRPAFVVNVQTGGGAFFAGDVTAWGDVTGRDKVVQAGGA